MKKFIYILMIMLLSAPVSAENFVPEQPIITTQELKPGMSGYILTVVKGTEPVKMPVKIVSVIPEKPGSIMKNKILIKFTGRNKLAQGMSGSPVFIKNKLIGGIRSGWDNSDQSLAVVTPIEAMIKSFNSGEELGVRSEELKTFNISVAGINADSVSRLSKVLGLNVNQGISLSSGNLEIKNINFKPGDAVAALLVWGDVEVSAAGTVTATSKDGKFLAFGHDFLNRGRVSYPSAGAFIHETVDSYSFPFKLASPLYINGVVTQDREEVIGGRTGVFAKSFEAELKFKNLDTGKQSKYKFRVIPDEFLSAKLIEEVYKGLITEAWGRKGQGTMKINLRVEGANIKNGFARSDIFFSDEDVVNEALKDSIEIINTYMTQPFNEIMPSGFILTVEATQQPKVLRIEDVIVPDSAKPGEEVEVKIKLRSWRKEITEKIFKLKIPENASGVVEVVVRGGGVEPMHQIAIEEGLKTVDSLERMFAEFKAADAANELFIEINSDTLGEALKNALNKNKNDDGEDFLPEELEFLSETKERRIKEGNLKIFSSDYVIDGMMKRIIHVNSGEKNNEK